MESASSRESVVNEEDNTLPILAQPELLHLAIQIDLQHCRNLRRHVLLELFWGERFGKGTDREILRCGALWNPSCRTKLSHDGAVGQ